MAVPQVPSSSSSFTDVWQAVFSPKWPVRINTLTGLSLIAVMGLFDAVQMVLPLFHVIPLAGTAVGFLGPFILGSTGTIILIMVFALGRVHFLDGKRAIQKVGAMLGPAAFEMVPFLSTLPMLTTGAIQTFVISRLEDRETYEKEAREQLNRIHAREMEAERMKALNAQAAIIRTRQEQNMAQTSQDTQELESLDNRNDQGESGPMSNTLVIKKKRLPTGQLPYTLPHELPIEERAPKTTAGQSWN